MPYKVLNMQINDAAIISLANTTTWAGALTSFAAAIAEWNLTSIAGFIAAVGGLAVNWYYRHCDKKRKDAESAARIAALKSGEYLP